MTNERHHEETDATGQSAEEVARVQEGGRFTPRASTITLEFADSEAPDEPCKTDDDPDGGSDR